MRRSSLSVVVSLVLVAPVVQAWNDQGHMMVAAAAYDRLTPTTKARVKQLLALSTYPVDGQNAASVDADKAAFMRAATAADAVKRSTAYVNDGNDAGSAPDAARNTGFDDKAQHRYWHYVDIPFSTDGTPVVETPVINAQERIALFRKTLASTAPDDVKAYDLVWLLHLVGDVHQPLHATSRFDVDQPSGDLGGNGVKLCAAPCKDGLHAYWDDVLGTDESVATAAAAAAKLAKPSAKKAALSDEFVWVHESFEAARTHVYRAPIGPGAGPYTLNAAYKKNAKRVARLRVALAGARLANLLNTELH